MAELKNNVSLYLSAAKAGMSERTARKYRVADRPPTQIAVPHTWRTREDPFLEVWDEIAARLENASGLQAKTVFEELQRQYPGRFQDGQLRSLQRRMKYWRAVEGAAREVFFAQQHFPGVLCASDFCHADRLGVTIEGAPFNHLLYHFVLTYSNWETGTICFSESFEALSEGLQCALWRLGGVPLRHRTDSLTAAVNNLSDPSEFTKRYEGLMGHYGLKAEHTQPVSPNENGDVEQSHNRFLNRLDQALMLRGSRDFADRGSYDRFLLEQFAAANAGRLKRFHEEHLLLLALPKNRLDARKVIDVRVGPSSTIQVLGNTYSVHSRMVGEQVQARVGLEEIELWYAQRMVQKMPRLRGKANFHINYRHIIDWLVRKPGAFAQYKYREALFPTSWFRMAYDLLHTQSPATSSKRYLQILELAAKDGQDLVESALREIMALGTPLDVASLQERMNSGQRSTAMDVRIAPVDLRAYDCLISHAQVHKEACDARA